MDIKHLERFQLDYFQSMHLFHYTSYMIWIHGSVM